MDFEVTDLQWHEHAAVLHRWERYVVADPSCECRAYRLPGRLFHVCYSRKGWAFAATVNNVNIDPALVAWHLARPSGLTVLAWNGERR